VDGNQFDGAAQVELAQTTECLDPAKNHLDSQRALIDWA
jgi:hypothetical protein